MAGNILPQGMTQFCDDNGNPLGLGFVYFYVPFTSAPKDTWQDAQEDVLNTNPVELDAAGRANIWGSGSYQQVVTDKDGNEIWNRIVSSGAQSGVEYIIAAPSDDLDSARVATNDFGVSWDFDTEGEASIKVTQAIMWPVGDETTPLAIGVVLHFRMPYAFHADTVRINVVTAQTSGQILRVNVLKSGVSILNGPLAIDNNEKTSVTAFIQPFILTPDLADDEEMSLEITQVSGVTTAAGLKFTMIGYHL